MMLLLCSCVILMIRYTHSQVFPSSFFFPADQTMSVNGSSATGNCSSVLTLRSQSRCDTPTSSVLFDGNIPTLTGLDGDMWATQLLTLQISNPSIREIISDFTDTPGYDGMEGIELVMFNCPEWGIAVQTVRLLTAASIAETTSLTQIFAVPTITSCDSLVRICIPVVIVQPVIDLEFTPPPDSNWTHLAEVTFYGSGSCPPDTVITTPPPDTTSPPPPLTTPATTFHITKDMPDCTTVSTQCEACPSCSTSTALASVITAIATALLATVISVLVMIAVCKCHPKFTPGGAEAHAGTSAGGEGQEYEDVDGGRGGVAVSDPTYMEVDGGGGRGGGNTFQLKENEKSTNNYAYM